MKIIKDALKQDNLLENIDIMFKKIGNKEDKFLQLSKLKF